MKPNPAGTVPRRAAVVGAGLIGGSVGMALRRAGWRVSLDDIDPAAVGAGLARGAADVAGLDVDAELVFVATPVGATAAVAREMLERTNAVVTDVGSVKAGIVEAVADPRFVGGHPMAGSEQEGIAGAFPEMFDGATWVLTPSDRTSADAYATVHSVVASLGAEVVSLAPSRHDEVVAMISHVPHLTAATLMGLAAGRTDDRGALMRLAAGGFRDMTRIAAGHPGIWPDICAQNAAAIGEVLESLIAELTEVAHLVGSNDRAALLARLEAARTARLNLPGTVARPEEMAEVLVTIPDRPGELAAITTLATSLGVNIYDVEIAHSSEGPAGVLIALVEQTSVEPLREALTGRGYRVSWRDLG